MQLKTGNGKQQHQTSTMTDILQQINTKLPNYFRALLNKRLQVIVRQVHYLVG